MRIKNEVKKFIEKESLSINGEIKNDTLIFESGLFDSMGLLFLIEFLNENYHIEITDEELNPKNFESINNIETFVEKKLCQINK